MSVYQRLRPESKLQYFATGEELETKVTKFVMNQNKVPKKWRLILGQNIINIANKMMENVIEANNVYTDTQEKLEHRLALQNAAIANVRQLDQKMRLLLNVVDTVSANSIEEICKLIYEEEEHLRKWKKTNRLITKDKTK